MSLSSKSDGTDFIEEEQGYRTGGDTSLTETVAPVKLSKNGTLASVNRVARHALVVEPRTLSPFEARRFVGERSRDLQSFVAPLEEVVRKAGKYRVRGRRPGNGPAGKVAELVLSTIRSITHRETGVFSMEPNVPLLLSALYAGSVEASIVAGLARRAQGVLNAIALDEREGHLRKTHGSSASRVVSEYDIGRELDEITMLLKWYARRKMSIAGLDVDHLARGGALNDRLESSFDEGDALFGFEVLHDQQVFGAKGCFVQCGLRLIGHDGQSLWLRVSVRWNGSPVAVRSAWGTWMDSAGSGFCEVVPKDAPFCSLVPIRPNAQRLVIDEIRAFVPYAALDLPSGRCDVDLVVSVVDSEGREVISASRPESICVPRSELIGAHVPAPHSVGMWPHDVVSGDKIADLRVSSGYKVIAGWERHTVSVEFDLSLFMHAGESVLLECRFIDSKGEVVELSSLGIPYVASERNVPVESVSSYRYRRVLHPRGAWSHYRGLSIDVPVEFLLLQPGAHMLTCEVVIVSSDERILCGDMGVFAVHVSGDTPLEVPLNERQSESSREFLPSSPAANIIELESIEIDPAWRFSGEEGVRVQATFCPKNASKQIADLAAGRVGELFSPYRVEVSIEREDGLPLLQAFSDALGMSFKPVTRGVCVEGHSGFAEHSIVAHFKRGELLGWYFGTEAQRANAKIRLFARVRALSLEGDVFLSETKEFFVRPLVGGGKEVVETGFVSPQIVDVVAHGYTQTPRMSCRALVNLPHGRYLEEGVTVRCSLIPPEGEPQRIFKHRIVAHQSAAWIRQQMGLSQVPVEFEGVLPEGHREGFKLECALVSAFNEVLHVVTQEVQPVGIIAEAEGLEGVNVGEGTGPLADGVSEPEEFGVAKTPAKGLLSWFRR